MSDSRLYPTGAGFNKSFKRNGTFVDIGVTKTQRTRATAAQVNAGLVLLPAIPGVKWRIVDAAMIAIGGAATGATSVDLLGTKAAVASRPLVIAVAALTQSALVRAGATNAVILADGASFTAHDANSSIKVTKQSGGSNLATATHVDVILTYVADAA
jgi:hypothetical protein